MKHIERPSLLRKASLAALDRKIAEYSLHSRGVEPVYLDAALEEYWYGFSKLPPCAVAMTYRWRHRNLDFVRITFDASLRKARATALKRHAGGHELTHIECDHKGYMWVFWRGQPRPAVASVMPPSDPAQEMECEYGAAYLLVPLRALFDLAGESTSYIARTLDVPEHLVGLRWSIWRKYGR